MKNNDFPQTFFIKIKNEEFKEARIVINSHGDTFSGEIDIVLTESRKIWAHVGMVLKEPSLKEAFDQSLIRLRYFLSGDRGPSVS